ncbi:MULTISPECIES: class I SAM-dependent methyltransferase [unclassified Pannonibacter]|uniref:class I SAM-dependent methyltransferase n=1 Tax=unclassified Pannonibacter TaxID=2627228 RepID=UPI001FCB34C8|nr:MULTISPECIES: class I SAM-dependent methyltransferase [unclassified Pannonibacter]
MLDWNNGYVADISYTHGFYKELTPANLSFAVLAKMRQAPSPEQPMRFCELGCGQGLSVNILAAANPHIEFYATDFNPAQIAGARKLAEDAALPNVHFYEHAFAEFAAEQSLPAEFDIIALHGIYSWISAENRGHIVEFIRRKLKPGGLVYISYNTLPGWANAMPLRRLLVDHAATRSGPIAPRIDQALSFADEMIKLGAGYFTQNAGVAPRFERMQSMARNYLAHEYFNRDWTPFYFQDVAQELSGAKLSFAASAHLLDHIDVVSLTTDQSKWLAQEIDPIRAEGLRDFLINQQFRRDIFVKGAVPLTLQASRDTWLDLRFALSLRREDVPLTIQGRFGDMTLQEDVYSPLLDGFANGPVTLRQLLAAPEIANLGWAKLMQAIIILVGSGHLHPCLSAKAEAKRRERTNALNKALFNRARSSDEVGFLASPVLGSGVPVTRFEQLFLFALTQGRKDPQQWAEFAWQAIQAQGQRLIKAGHPLETDAENLGFMVEQAVDFAEKRLTALKSLQVF